MLFLNVLFKTKQIQPLLESMHNYDHEGNCSSSMPQSTLN